MPVPDDLLYTLEHEWVRLDGDEAVMGITEFAQDQLGDIVFVELPEPGARTTMGEPFGEVESVKTVSDLFCPLSGEVVARNDALTEHPELVNESPHDEGWMVRVTVSDRSQLAGLLDAAAYRAHVAQG